MNRRFYCAVGLASGVILLGGGVAQAAGTADEAGLDIEPTTMHGLPTDIYRPSGEQHRFAASIGTLVDLAGKKAADQAHTEIRANTESLSGSHMTNSGRAELLPNIGAGSAGADGLLGGLLGGLPGGSLLGKLATDGPIGQLLGNGPLGGLLGPKKTPADNKSTSTAATAVPSRPQAPATKNDGAATDPHQAWPAGERPSGTTGTRMTDPALSGMAANPTPPLPVLNQPTQPAPYQMDGAAAVPGDVAQAEPAPGAGYGGEGLEEKQLLGGSLFGPGGPLGSMQLLGGETLAGLPLVGELLAGGLSVDRLGSLTGITENPAGAQAGDKAAAGLAMVGKLSRALLGGGPASAPTEAVSARRTLAIDKKKVTPELKPLFGHDALGTQALNGMIHYLPSAG